MPTVRKNVLLFDEAVKEPQLVLADWTYWREGTCRRWLSYTEDQVHADCDEALRLAIHGVRYARRVARRQYGRGLRRGCVLARAFSVLGSVYRARGDLEKAAHALAKAGELAEVCRDADERAEVLLRRAILRIYLAKREESLADPAFGRGAFDLADRAANLAKSGLTKARSLNARATVLAYQEDADAARRDAAQALLLLDPKAQPFDHLASLSVLLYSYSLEPASQRGPAIEAIRAVHDLLPARAPMSRARLLWTEALLLGSSRKEKARARRYLDQARRRFLKLGMAAEAVAVTADLTRMAPEGAVPRLCSDVLAILPQGKLREKVQELREVRMVDRVRLAECLRELVVGPGVLPVVA